MIGRGLVNRAVAIFIAAGAGFVAMVALGATVYYLLALVVVPLAAAAITSAIFAVIALIVALIFVRRAHGEEDEEDYEPEGLGMRAFHLFQQRPILGAAAALAGGWIFLRNPALATMVAAAFTEKSRPRRR